MEWGKAQSTDSKAISIPTNWLYIYYYEALNILFRFENSLRLFVYLILKRELGKEWDLAALSEGATIRSETKKRFSQAKEHGYLGYEISSPVMYLNSGELTEVIVSDAYWKHFAPYFKAKKQVIQTKLQEIGTVRNALAHFRPIKKDDVELIKQNVMHVLMEIEKRLTTVLSIQDVVPTNSPDDWYKTLKPIGGTYSKVDLYSSTDRDWVRIDLTYDVPTLTRQQYGPKYFSFKLASLHVSKILDFCPTIRESCIFISESPTFGTFVGDFEVDVNQTVSAIFPRKSLTKSFTQIGEELRDLALKIDSETTFVIEDNLAQGDVIRPVSASASYVEPEGQNPYWNFDTGNLKSDISETDQVEFWGQRIHYVDDFIATTSRYPWMPTSISAPNWYD